MMLLLHHYDHHHRHFSTNCGFLLCAYVEMSAIMQVFFLTRTSSKQSDRASPNETVELLTCNLGVPASNLVLFLILSKQIAGMHLTLIRPPIPPMSLPTDEQFNIIYTYILINKFNPRRSNEGPKWRVEV
jgi:hypothetical protein